MHTLFFPKAKPSLPQYFSPIELKMTRSNNGQKMPEIH
jgi:hypothetical protein